MKVGVLSDSHGNQMNLEGAAKWLIEEEKVDALIHLGDDWDDTKVLEKFRMELIRVPGVFELLYRDSTRDPAISNRLIKTFDNKKVLISRTEESHKNNLAEDLKPEKVIAKKEVDLALVGHSHIPKIEDREGVLIFNPGHLKSEDKKRLFAFFWLD